MGKVGSIIITIAKVIGMIGLAGCLAGTILVGIMPKDLLTISAQGSGTIEVNLDAIGASISEEDMEKINSSDGLEDGSVKLDVSGNGVAYNFTEMYAEGNSIFLSETQSTDSVSVHDFVYALIIATITMAMSVVSLFFAGFLCKAFKTCRSPFEENVIKKMQQFAYSLLPWVILSSISKSMVNSLTSGSLDVNVTIDLTMVLIVLVILALSYIFKYGAVLQQESDETL